MAFRIKSLKTTYAPKALHLFSAIGLEIETIGDNTARRPLSVHLGHQSFTPSDGVACRMGIAVKIVFPGFSSLFWTQLNRELNSLSNELHFETA